MMKAMMKARSMTLVAVVTVALAGWASGGGCVDDGSPTGTTARAVRCSEGGACAAGEACVEGWCMPACATDADCPAGVCIVGICEFTPEPWTCLAHADCPAGSVCEAGACVFAGCVPAVEVCNGIDDDCDWAVDEEGGCSLPCATGADCDDGLFCNGQELCAAGVCVPAAAVSCDDGDPATVDTCDEATDACRHAGCTPAPEVCNGIDDDCDGTVDEGFDLLTDPANCGACGAVCDAGMSCTDGICFRATCTPAPEVCNGIDDDCDWAVDEEGGCSLPCDTDADCDDGRFCNGQELCAAGVCAPAAAVLCDDGDPATVDTCDEATDTCRHVVCTPAAEVCNGYDDDCDGTVDEGFNLATDPANCGACGNACAAGESCAAGVCVR